jgi:hypothetical protein
MTAMSTHAQLEALKVALELGVYRIGYQGILLKYSSKLN